MAKIALYVPEKLGSPLRWYPNAMCTVFRELGHECKITSSARESDGCDITFIMGFYMQVWGEAGDWEDCRKYSPTVWINTEQLTLGTRPLDPVFDKVDAIAEVIPENLKYYHYLDRLVRVFDMPFGYHESMTFGELPFFEHPNIHYGWDIFLMEYPKPKPHHGDENRDKWHEYFGARGYKVFDGLPIYHPKQVAVYARYGRFCVSTHAAVGQGLPAAKIIGLFLANGGFVMHQSCKEYPYLVDGEHIVYFDGPQDFSEKFQFYKRNGKERERIQIQAFNHIKSKVTMKEFVGRALPRIFEELC